MANKPKRLGRAVKWVLLAGTVLAAAFVLFACVTVCELDAWEAFDPERILGADQTLILYDGQDAEITRLHGAEDRVSIALHTLPRHVPYAFISAEDARFYRHVGIDVIRIMGAAWEDLKAGSYVQGASTISQQLVKLSHLSAEKTIARKLEEAVLAFRMEQLYTKDQVLEMYLNYVYFGGGYYGVEAAALGYFGVHAAELSVAQAAMLAGILKSPSHYAPHLDLEASIARRDLVLGLMCDYGHISEAVRDEARAETPVIVRGSGAKYRRGYYVDTALREAALLLGISGDELLTGGYRVYTALDAGLQGQCEAVFADGSFFPADAQAAIVIQKAGSGLIPALLGGRGESAALSFNRATDIRRQPGSLIKPVLCYAPALETHGYTAATLLLDEQETFGDYTPNNFGSKYYGWVTLRTAVTKSLNVPAVRVLSDVGVKNARRFAQTLGIAFDETDDSLALALGGFTYGVSPYMMAGAYNCFASGGVYYAPTLIRRITDEDGKELYAYSDSGTRALSEQNAYILSSMLQSVVSEGTGRRLGELGIELAGKTGTVGESEGNRDAWMAAYNPAYTAVVWMGYDSAQDGRLPEEATGGKYPALVLGEIYGYLYADTPAPAFTMPEGVVEVRLDGYTLKNKRAVVLATALTPKSSVTREVFVAGTEPTAQSDYWTVPLPAGAFSARLGDAGYPLISFTPRQSYVVYRLYRREDNGKTICLESFSGAKGKVDYVDTKARPGMGYTYYVEPEHPQMRLNGKGVTGPASSAYRVEAPKLSLTPRPENKRSDGVLDLRGIGGE